MTYLSQLLTENLLIVCSYILASEEHDASLADYTGISRCSASILLPSTAKSLMKSSAWASLSS